MYCTVETVCYVNLLAISCHIEVLTEKFTPNKYSYRSVGGAESNGEDPRCVR